MKVIIAGSRSAKSEDVAIAMHRAMGTVIIGKITSILSGGESGAGVFGSLWARARHYPLHLFLADWAHSRKAGTLRNTLMVAEGEALVVVWNGQSADAVDIIKKATQRGLPTYVHIMEQPAKD